MPPPDLLTVTLLLTESTEIILALYVFALAVICVAFPPESVDEIFVELSSVITSVNPYVLPKYA